MDPPQATPSGRSRLLVYNLHIPVEDAFFQPARDGPDRVLLDSGDTALSGSPVRLEDLHWITER